MGDLREQRKKLIKDINEELDRPDPPRTKGIKPLPRFTDLLLRIRAELQKLVEAEK